MIGATFTTAVQQAPGLPKLMLSTGSLESQLTTLEEIESYLEQVLCQLCTNVANTLSATQSDYKTFLTQTVHGSLLVGPPSLSGFTADVSHLMKTFFVAHTLDSHDIIVTVARNFSIDELSHKT